MAEQRVASSGMTDLNSLYERAHAARRALAHQRANSLEMIELGGRVAMAMHDENETSAARIIRVRGWLAGHRTISGIAL